MNKLETIALENYIIRRTVPILSTQTKDGGPALLGTSTLFDIDGRLFLVTAAHLFEAGIDLHRLAIPASPFKSQIWVPGSFEKIGTRDEDVDFAALEIKSPEMAAVLRSGWDSVTFDSIALADKAGRFVLSGYPGQCTDGTSDPAWLKGKLISIYTDRLPRVPSNATKPVYNNLDVFFLCDDSAEDLSGNKVTIPKLEGTSGASVWQVHEPASGQVWSPEAVLRIVAIQSAYRPQEYFRGKSWRFGAQMFLELDDPGLQPHTRALADRLDAAHAPK